MYIAMKKELEELEYTIKNFYESIIEEQNIGIYTSTTK